MSETAKPAAADPETPDGPEPHALPLWPYFCVERPLQIAAPGAVSSALWSLALTPYLAFWGAAGMALGVFDALSAPPRSTSD
jgi:hypothetical protein